MSRSPHPHDSVYFIFLFLFQARTSVIGEMVVVSISASRQVSLIGSVNAKCTTHWKLITPLVQVRGMNWFKKSRRHFLEITKNSQKSQRNSRNHWKSWKCQKSPLFFFSHSLTFWSHVVFLRLGLQCNIFFWCSSWRSTWWLFYTSAGI